MGTGGKKVILLFFFSKTRFGNPKARSSPISLLPIPFRLASPRAGAVGVLFGFHFHPKSIPPETGFLALAPKIRGRGDKLRENSSARSPTILGQSPAWPDFEIPESAFWAALTEIVPFTVSRRVPGILSVVRRTIGEVAMG